jgi:hypothetical protein
MVKHGKSMYKIVHHVTFLMWMEKLTYFFVIILACLSYMLCKQFSKVTTMLVCDWSSRG